MLPMKCSIKSGSIATPGPEQADPNTPVATGGTAPIGEFGASAIVADGQKPSANSTPNSTIRVADLMGLVKGDAHKYIPNRAEMGSAPMVDTSEPSARGGQQKGSGMPEKTSYDEYILRNEDGTPFEAMGAASLGISVKQKGPTNGLLLQNSGFQSSEKCAMIAL